MKKAIIALIAVFYYSAAPAHIMCENALLAGPNTFQPEQIGQMRLGDKNSWVLKWSKGSKGNLELLAVQKSTLLVKRIDPATGTLVNERPYLGGGRKPSDVDLLSLGSGELGLLGIYGQEGRLDFYSDEAASKASVTLSSPIRFAKIFSTSDHKDFVVMAATANEIKFFKRHGEKLDVVASLTAPGLIRNANAFQIRDGEVEIIIHGLDHKVRLLKLTLANNQIAETKSFTQLGGRVFAMAQNDQIILAMIENDGPNSRVRIYSTAKNAFSPNMRVGQILEAPVLGEDVAGNPKVLLAVRENGQTRVVGMDPLTGQTSLAARVGDARQIRNVGQFFTGFKPYYVFASDGVSAQIQSANESSLIPSPRDGYIKQLTDVRRLPDGRQVLAVLGESSRGTSVNILNLTK